MLFFPLTRLARRKKARQRRGFWWCCCGGGSGEGSGSDAGSEAGSEAPTCCDEIWWPTNPIGSPNYPDLTATISGSCCTGFQDINHSFAMNRTTPGGRPQWDFTWTLNLTGFPPFNDCRNGSLSNAAVLRCSDGRWTINLVNTTTIPPPHSIEMTLLACSPFHATASVPDTFWGAQVCSNTSFLEITE